MSKKIRLIFLALGLAFFCYLVAHFGLQNIILNIRRTGWWFLAIVGIWGFVYFLNTISFRIILGSRAKGVSLLEIYRITLSSFALNYATPLASLGGEAYRAMAIQDLIGPRDAVSSVLVFRMIHSTAHFFFWMISIVLIALLLPLPQHLRIILAAMFALTVLFTYLFFSAERYGIFVILYRILSKIPFLRGLEKRLQRREELLIDLDSKIRELYNGRRESFYIALMIEVLSRFASSFEFYFILHAVGLHVSPMYAFYISAATSIILNIFFFIPYELGTREGSLYLIMHSLGLSPGLGIYIGLVNRVRSLFWILIGLILIRISGENKSQPDRT